MSAVTTVFAKEIRVTLRDRRTLISAIIIPAFAFPLLMWGFGMLTKQLLDEERSKTLTVAILGAPAGADSILAGPGFNRTYGLGLQAAQDSVKAEVLDAALVFAPTFGPAATGQGSGQVRLLFKSTNGQVEERLMARLDTLKAHLLQARVQQLGLASGWLKPVAVTRTDLASAQEQIGTLVGGFLPYIFILFCFMGCLYPALDIVTGEKEKGTLETLLTTPAARLHLLLGKMLAIATIGLSSALLAMGGMFATLRLMQEIPPELLATLGQMVSLRFAALLLAMLLPLSFFFAGLLTAVSIRANSFKEAQTYVTPLTFLVIVPAAIAAMPGTELSWKTVWIPVLNLALATKQIMAGSLDVAQYLAVLASLVVFALLALAASVRQFSKEGNILK